eukprot:PhM_4_TR18768/c1_g1_i14/m.4381
MFVNDKEAFDHFSRCGVDAGDVQIKEFMRSNFSGKDIYCRGHWAKVMLDHLKPVLTEEYPCATAAAKLFCNMFFRAETRVGRFRAVYEEVVNTPFKNATLIELKSFQHAMSTLTPDDVLSMAKRFLPEIAMCTEADAVKEIDKQQEDEASARHVKSPKLSNETRWLTSTFSSYIFFRDHYDIIYKFLHQENALGLASASVIELSNLLVDHGTKVTTELHDLITCLQPYANFLTIFSDFSTVQPTAHRVFREEETLRLQLMSIRNERVREIAIKEFEGYRPGAERQVELWATIRWFDPCFARAMVNAGKEVSCRDVVKNVGLDVDVRDWAAYMAMVRTHAATCPVKFWEGVAPELPNLASIALTLLWLPPVVTACDSVFSMESAVFNSRRAATTPDHAASVLMAKANGDVSGENPNVRHWWGDSRSVQERRQDAEKERSE